MNLLKNGVSRGVVVSLILVLISSIFFVVEASDSELLVDVAASINYNYGGGEQVIDANLSVQASDPVSNLCGAKVYISGNFNKHEDSLTFNNITGLTATYNSNNGVLEVTGIADVATYQDFLRGIKLNTTATTGTKRIEYIVNRLQDGKEFNLMYFNGHFYEFVNATNISWSDARDAASQRSICGINGYLAVITSQEENEFVASKCEANGWLGAEDNNQEGEWKWVTSPNTSENTQFWSGLGSKVGGITVNNMYNNWNAGVEPNNHGNNEDYLHMHSGYWDGIFHEEMKGTWNDFPHQQIGNMGGYIVEYGDRFLNIIDVDWIDSVDVNITGYPNPPIITYSNSHKILKFDGDDYIDIGSMTLSNSFTIEMWTKWSARDNWRRFFDFGIGTENNNILASVSGNTTKNLFQIRKDNEIKDITTTQFIPDNEWIHTAFIYDDNTKKMLIYWNGQLMIEGEGHIKPNIERTTNYLGRSNWSTDSLFNGYMKDVRVWNYAKSAKQIVNEMHNNLTGAEQGLLAYYPLNEESGNTANNLVCNSSAGFSSTASISGCASWQDYNKADFPVSTLKNTPISIDIDIFDCDTNIENIQVAVTSDNESLISNNNILVSGTGSAKKIALTPNTDEVGSANITIEVQDDVNTVTEIFRFNVFDDQDGVVSLSSNTFSVNENNSINVIVNKTGGMNKTTKVICEVAGITADSDDFSVTGNELIFNVGESTKNFIVNINDDSIIECNETISINLKNIYGGAVCGIKSATLTIVDDEIDNGPPVVLKSTPELLYTKKEDFSDRDGLLISEIVKGRIDYPNGTKGVAITSVNNNGLVQYLKDGYWYSITDVSENNAFLLPDNVKLIFIPNDNWNGDAYLKMRGWDLRSGTAFKKADTTINGINTGFSVNELQLYAEITPVNDAPLLNDLSQTKLLYFDGNKFNEDGEDYAQIDAIIMPDSFTIEISSKWLAHQNWSRLFDFGNGEPGLNIWAGMEGLNKRLIFESYIDSNNSKVVSGIMPLNEWTRTAFVYNHLKNTGYIYVNGVLKQSGALAIKLNEVRNNNYFGKSNWAVDDLFKGYLKDIRIWDRALNEKQINENLNKELSGNELGLIAYYKVDEGVANKLFNSVSTSSFSNATVHGANWVKSSGINTSISTLKNTPVEFKVKVEDVDTPLNNLILSAISNDENLIANSNISCTLTGDNGTLILNPNNNKTGSCTICVKVSDGEIEHTEKLILTVYDNENGVIGFVSSDYTINENVNELPIPIERTVGNNGVVTVNYSVTGGSAVVGSDYEALTGSINFTDGESGTKNIVLKLINDNIHEKNETVKIKLSQATGGATLLLDETTVTIQDDDSANNTPVANNQTVTITKNTTYNGTLTGIDADNDSLTFIKVSDPTNGVVTVNSDGGFIYTANANYIGADSFKFKVNDSNEDSADATVIITVNDTAPPVNNGIISLKQATYKVTEGTAYIEVQITRTGGSDGAVSVDYTTVDESAIAGTDYTTKSGTISFSDGDSAEKIITIPITNDSVVEGSQVFKLQICNATGGASIGTSETLITVIDNDTLPDDDDEDEIKPKVKGSVRDSSTGKVKKGTKVIISKDFDGDGIVDYSYETTTDENGNYEMNVPNANEHYNITIIEIIELDGKILEIPFTQQVNVGKISKENSEVYANKTAAGIVYAPKSSNGASILEHNELSLIVTDDSGNIINSSLNRNTGIFIADQLEEGKKYKFSVVYQFPNGQQVNLGNTTISPNNDGEICIGQILIDPFGIITDSVTEEVITGVYVKLYYADTNRNSAKGNIAGALVNLYKVDDLPPANNKNPQFSNSEGKYAFMVFPEADYYIEAFKEGYVPFTSDVISVEQDLVEYNFSMVKKDLDFTKNFYNEIAIDDNSSNNNEVKGTVQYQNNSTQTYQDVVITVPIPDGMEVVEVIEGEVVDGQLVWKIGNVEPNESGNVHFKIKYNGQNDYKIIKLISVISSENNGKVVNTNGAGQPFIAFSSDYLFLTQSYLMGYEDKTVRPDQYITRAEMISLFARLLGSEVRTSKENYYTDVTPENWYYNNIVIAYENGLLEIYNDDLLQPQSNVTKAELAFVIAKFLGLKKQNSNEQYFTDIKGHIAEQYINQLYRLNIFINGSTLFNPHKAITRAEAIVEINRMLHRTPITDCDNSFIDLTKEHWAFGDIEAAARSLALR